MFSFSRFFIFPFLLVPAHSFASTAEEDFQARCAHAEVVRCVDFDQASDIEGTYGDNYGTLPGAASPELDVAVAASGGSSLKLTIPSNSGANSSGSFFTNFSEDLTVQFDSGDQFYIQWRQRFSPEFLDTVYSGGGGWKQVIIGTGDKPGCTPSSSASGLCYSSCTALETVVQNTYHRGFSQMYNSCTGSDSHGPYDGFEERYGSYDFKLQNAMPEPFCLYSQAREGTQFPPTGNCVGYFPNEWMTFQVGITLGQRQGNEWKDSNIKLWIAREGEASQLALDYGPYNLTAGNPDDNQQYGKVWLLNYNTRKDSSQEHPIGYTWYDELIISTSRIPDPQVGVNSSTPNPPTSLRVQ